jgi:phosphoribosylformylglycinamidine cyclo-ligase
VLGKIHAMAHITGGGLPGNLDRVLPAGLSAVVNRGTWEIPPLFAALQEAGSVPDDEMFRVFNMGVGLVAITPAANAEAVIGSARVAGITGWIMGEVQQGSGEVILD